MEITRIIHPVGQGGFYSEKLVDGAYEINMIYDCGGNSKALMESYLEHYFSKSIRLEKKDNNTEEKPEVKSLGINQESLNEFEKKLQLALEQEAKDKNNNENLVDTNPAPIKQKKEDPKFDEIKSILGKEIVESLFSPKWETKKHGFELINEFINTKPKQSYNINDLIEYMKLKLKNYKETNFNINREAINIYINMIKKKIL